jgi:hypothetical protein
MGFGGDEARFREIHVIGANRAQMKPGFYPSGDEPWGSAHDEPRIQIMIRRPT